MHVMTVKYGTTFLCCGHIAYGTTLVIGTVEEISDAKITKVIFMPSTRA